LRTNYTGGSVVLEEGAFTDHVWVSATGLADYDLIEGLDVEAKLALES